MNKVILYIATSQDGFIADNDGNIDWLPEPKDDAELEVVGYYNLMSRIDTILMGSRTYEQVIGFGDWGWPDKQTYVFTFKQFENDKPYITMTDDSPRKLITTLKKRNSDKDIWLMGGAQLVQSFAKDNLIDEVIITVIPQKLGSGLPLGLSFEGFDLTEENFLHDGMIQKMYVKRI